MGLWSRTAFSRAFASESFSSASFCAVMSREVMVAATMRPPTQDRAERRFVERRRVLGALMMVMIWPASACTKSGVGRADGARHRVLDALAEHLPVDVAVTLEGTAVQRADAHRVVDDDDRHGRNRREGRMQRYLARKQRVVVELTHRLSESISSWIGTLRRHRRRVAPPTAPGTYRLRDGAGSRIARSSSPAAPRGSGAR